jgi:hypothetical protein
MGESMQKGASRAKVKVLSKDYIFHVKFFNWFIMHFSNLISNLRSNMIYNIIKAQILLQQALHYS